jgi:hypothetical protein
MKAISSAVAALALSAMFATGATTPAKADGGATVAIVVGSYLLVDALVGRTCHRHEWPFNILAKVADEIHGRPGCDRYGHHHYHHRPYK